MIKVNHRATEDLFGFRRSYIVKSQMSNIVLIPFKLNLSFGAPGAPEWVQEWAPDGRPRPNQEFYFAALAISACIVDIVLAVSTISLYLDAKNRQWPAVLAPLGFFIS